MSPPSPPINPMAFTNSLLLLILLTTFASMVAPSRFIHFSPRCSPAPEPSPAPPQPSAGVRAGYWPSWLYNFPPSSINLSYFTHIYYAFIQPDPNTFELIITAADDLMLKNFITTLHSASPPVAAILSIGGGASSQTTFDALVSVPSFRAAFINSSINVARLYGADGLDFDWEWPENQERMYDLAILFIEWRATVRRESAASGRTPLLLTSAVYFSPHFFTDVPRQYPVPAMAENLDWISPMCFDYHGSWDTWATAAPAALYDAKSNVSTSYGITSWINAGMPAAKIVMGMPVYGRTWQLKSAAEHGIGAPAVGVGPSDNGTGIMTYDDIQEYIVNHKAETVFDEDTVSAYAYREKAWIGYDDVNTVVMKLEFAMGRRLGGYFFWAIGYDVNWSIARVASQVWRASDKLEFNN